jgi:hypothetical protein
MGQRHTHSNAHRRKTLPAFFVSEDVAIFPTSRCGAENPVDEAILDNVLTQSPTTRYAKRRVSLCEDGPVNTLTRKTPTRHSRINILHTDFQ